MKVVSRVVARLRDVVPCSDVSPSCSTVEYHVREGNGVVEAGGGGCPPCRITGAKRRSLLVEQALTRWRRVRSQVEVVYRFNHYCPLRALSATVGGVRPGTVSRVPGGEKKSSKGLLTADMPSCSIRVRSD